MTYGNETNALLKIEADFVQQKSELFLFMLDCVTTQIVAGGQASEAWKESLKEYCQDTFQRTKERMQSHSVANLTSLQPQMPETFQINMVSDFTLCILAGRLLHFQYVMCCWSYIINTWLEWSDNHIVRVSPQKS